MKLLRSVIFTPGNSMRMIHKIPNLRADAVILDLEDSVPMTDKDTARVFVKDSILLAGSGDAQVYVRVNGLMTELTVQDCELVIQKRLNGIVLPKAESKKDILVIEKIIENLEKDRDLKQGSILLIPILETAKAVINVYEIATASKRVVAVGFGAVDYTRDMGITLTREGKELFHARSQIAIAAKAAGVQALDTVFIDIADREALTKDSQTAKQLGFTGKFLIHPSQIKTVNKIFSPSKQDIEYARKIVKTFKEAEARGLGATSFEGKMIDTATYRQALNLLELAATISEK